MKNVTQRGYGVTKSGIMQGEAKMDDPYKVCGVCYDGSGVVAGGREVSCEHRRQR